MIRLSIAIQTHPSRHDAAWSLLGKLADEVEDKNLDVAIQVIPDPEPRSSLRSPWRTAQVCWACSTLDFTHRLVIQDDAIPCDGFVEKALAAIAAKPESLVTFYVGRYPGQAARAVLIGLDDGSPLVDIGLTSWTPCVALAMPTPLALSLAGQTERRHYPLAMCADDAIVSLWRQDEGIAECWATVPSLVDHDSSIPSLMGTDPDGMRMAISVDPSLPERPDRLVL